MTTEAIRIGGLTDENPRMTDLKLRRQRISGLIGKLRQGPVIHPKYNAAIVSALEEQIFELEATINAKNQLPPVQKWSFDAETREDIATGARRYYKNTYGIQLDDNEIAGMIEAMEAARRARKC